MIDRWGHFIVGLALGALLGGLLMMHVFQKEYIKGQQSEIRSLKADNEGLSKMGKVPPKKGRKGP